MTRLIGRCRLRAAIVGGLALLLLVCAPAALADEFGNVDSVYFDYMAQGQPQGPITHGDFGPAPTIPGDVVYNTDSPRPATVTAFNYIDDGGAPGASLTFFTEKQTPTNLTVFDPRNTVTPVNVGPAATGISGLPALESVAEQNMVLPAQGSIGFYETGDVVGRDNEVDYALGPDAGPCQDTGRSHYFISAAQPSPGVPLNETSECDGLFDFYATVDPAVGFTNRLMVHGTNYDVYEVAFVDAAGNVIPDTVDGVEIGIYGDGWETANDCNGDPLFNPKSEGNGYYYYCLPRQIDPESGQSGYTVTIGYGIRDAGVASTSFHVNLPVAAGAAHNARSTHPAQRGAAVRVPLHCSGRGPCSYSVSLLAAEKINRGRTISPIFAALGQRSTTLRRGADRVLTIPLSPAGRRLLAKDKRLIATVWVRSSSAGTKSAQTEGVRLLESLARKG